MSEETHIISVTYFIFVDVSEHCHFQSPSENVLAIGLADGRIILHDLKFDDTKMTFTQDWGHVTAISFRTGQ